MVNDNIADLLTRIRNACMVKNRIVKVLDTRMSKDILGILKSEGLIENFKIINENKHSYIVILLKYTEDSSQPVITHLKRISKPGLRVYVKSKNIPKVLNNLGISILSTSKGILTNFQAKRMKVGGELLCCIW